MNLLEVKQKLLNRKEFNTTDTRTRNRILNNGSPMYFNLPVIGASPNKLINELEDNSVVILFSGSAPKKSLDEQYPYAVNRNFYYETGIEEANDILLISKIDNKVKVNLFIS